MAERSGYITVTEEDNDEIIEGRNVNYKFSRYEMETTVNFNAEEKTAVLYTRDKAVMRRLDRLVKEFPDIFKCIAETDVDKTYEFPKKYALPHRPRIRVLTDEQREEARDRLAKARQERLARMMSENDDLDDEFEDDELEDEENGTLE